MLKTLKTKRRWIFVCALLIVGFLIIWPTEHLRSRIRLGYQTTSILEGATRVEAYRVQSPIETDSPETGKSVKAARPTGLKINGYDVIAVAPQQEPAFAAQITKILLDENTYTSNDVACLMEPGVIFRVWKGRQRVDVVLCFHCGQMIVASSDVRGKETHLVYTLMAGNSYQAFLRLAKQVFPMDSTLDKP